MEERPLIWRVGSNILKKTIADDRKIPDDGQQYCWKHVELYSKNKFEKLVHLVGFIIRIYHDALSPELQKMCIFAGRNEWRLHNIKKQTFYELHKSCNVLIE